MGAGAGRAGVASSVSSQNRQLGDISIFTAGHIDRNSALVAARARHLREDCLALAITCDNDPIVFA